MPAQTPEAAAQLLCPLARTFAAPKPQEGCRGPSCALWRWQPIAANDPRVTAALAKIAKELGGGPNRTKQATEILMKDRAAYGVPTEPEKGFCGAGGGF